MGYETQVLLGSKILGKINEPPPPPQQIVNPFTGQTEAFRHNASAEDIRAGQINGGFQQQGQLNRSLGQRATKAADATKTDFDGFQANLNQNFDQYRINPTGALDSTSQRLLGQQRQAQAGQLATQQAANARALGVNNPALAVVNAQAASRGMLNNNSNQLNAVQQQLGRQMATNQFNSGLQQTANQTQLGQQGFNAGLQQAGNSAQAQQVGLASVPAQLNQDLLARMGAAKDGK